jgi:hypothetical protein
VGGVGQPEQQGAVATFGSTWLVNGLGRRAGEGPMAGQGLSSMHAIISFERSNGNQATTM